MIYLVIIIIVRLVLELGSAHRPHVLWEILYGIFLSSCGIMIVQNKASQSSHIEHGWALVFLGVGWVVVACIYSLWKRMTREANDSTEDSEPKK